jgi:hypothetical protein
LWRDAGTLSIKKTILGPDHQTVVRPGVHLGLTHREVHSGGFAPWFHDRVELRCRKERRVLFENEKGPTFSVRGGFGLMDGQWLVVEYVDHFADEGYYGYHVDATVVDLLEVCR